MSKYLMTVIQTEIIFKNHHDFCENHRKIDQK